MAGPPSLPRDVPTGHWPTSLLIWPTSSAGLERGSNNIRGTLTTTASQTWGVHEKLSFSLTHQLRRLKSREGQVQGTKPNRPNRIADGGKWRRDEMGNQTPRPRCFSEFTLWPVF